MVTLNIPTNIVTLEINLLMKQPTLNVMLVVKNTKLQETLHVTRKTLLM